MITMTKDERNVSLDAMHNNFFYWTELIQSSPEAIEESVKSVIGGGYRASNITLQELRFNPMFRNRGGEKDLDHIIMAAAWGLNRAMLEYPQVKAGIILMMDRTLTFKQNEIILQKAIKYSSFGVIGIDLAGPQRRSFSMKKHAILFKRAQAHGLGVTLHTGEEGAVSELEFVVQHIKPHRIGHGILAVKKPSILKAMKDQHITLELCPTSNIKNSVVPSTGAFKSIVRKIQRSGVHFTINTDGPEMYQTNILHEQDFLVRSKILTPQEVSKSTKWAFESSFVDNWRK